MNGGSKIIDLHVSDVEYAAADEPLQLTEPYEGEVFEQPEERSGATKWRIFAAIAVLAALAWVGFFAWYAWPAMQAAPSPTVLAELATGLTAPLALIAVLWLVARRSSRIEARRFNDTARSMRAEAEHLQAVIDVMAQTIDSIARSWPIRSR